MSRFGRPIRESTIEAACCRLASSHGWWHRKFKSPGKRSAPDRIFARQRGPWQDTFFVEFKAPGKRPTTLQLQEHEAMREAGLLVYVCDDKEKFQLILEHHTHFNSD